MQKSIYGTKKKDHSFKNAFVHHCLLNLMLYDWGLLSLSEVCPLLLHCMTFYHTASFRQVLIILCSVVIQYCGMGYGLFCSRWITCKQIWGFFSLWMFTGTKLYMYMFTYCCVLLVVLFKTKRDLCGFVKILIVALLLSFIFLLFFFLHRLHICFEVTVKLHYLQNLGSIGRKIKGNLILMIL